MFYKKYTIRYFFIEVYYYVIMRILEPKHLNQKQSDSSGQN